MPAQSRRPASRPSRAQRRAGASTSRTYDVPAARPLTMAPRRVYSTEPAPIDYTQEFGFVRKDLRRVLLWATLIFIAMLVVAFFFGNLSLF